MEYEKELAKNEEWIPNLGFMGVLEAVEELKAETAKLQTKI